MTNFLFNFCTFCQNKPLRLKNREWFFLFLEFLLSGNHRQYPAKIPVSSFESENGARGRKFSPAKVSPKFAHFARLALCKDGRNHCNFSEKKDIFANNPCIRMQLECALTIMFLNSFVTRILISRNYSSASPRFVSFRILAVAKHLLSPFKVREPVLASFLT